MPIVVNENRILARALNSTYNPGAVHALVSRLRYGLESGAVLLLGDSTADASNEWFSTAMQWLGQQFPTYTVTHTAWNDTLQGWDPSSAPNGVTYQLQVGTGGDAYVLFNGTGSNFLSTPDVAALRITGDLDVRVKARAVDWTPASDVNLTSKYGGAGNRGWRFYLTTAGNLSFQASQDGTAIVAVTSSAAVGFSDNTDGWVRFTFAASTSKVDFYTSSDGITWNALGTQQTLTAITALFASTQAAEIGTRGGGFEVWNGRIYFVEWRSGIAGLPVVICDLDSAMGSAADIVGNGSTFPDSLGRIWTLNGAATSFAGSPGLLLFNGSVSGQAIAYANDGTRGPKLRAILPPDLAFISYSHNESGPTLTYRTVYKQLADALVAAFPDVGVVATTQNPRISPAPNPRSHTVRNREIASLAAVLGYGLVDAYAAFSADPRGLATLVDSGGIHPTQAGSDLWRDVVKSLFAPWLTAPTY